MQVQMERFDRMPSRSKLGAIADDWVRGARYCSRCRRDRFNISAHKSLSAVHLSGRRLSVEILRKPFGRQLQTVHSPIRGGTGVNDGAIEYWKGDVIALQ